MHKNEIRKARHLKIRPMLKKIREIQGDGYALVLNSIKGGFEVLSLPIVTRDTDLTGMLRVSLQMIEEEGEWERHQRAAMGVYGMIQNGEFLDRLGGSAMLVQVSLWHMIGVFQSSAELFEEDKVVYLDLGHVEVKK